MIFGFSVSSNFFDLFVIVSVVDYKYYELNKWMYIWEYELQVGVMSI